MTNQPQPSSEDEWAWLHQLIARHQRYQDCEKYHIHYGSHSNEIPLAEHQNFDENELEQAIIDKLKAREAAAFERGRLQYAQEVVMQIGAALSGEEEGR